VGAIGSASLLADLGHEIPTALLPSFLTSTLGAPAAALGAIEGVADGLAGAARFAGGALADDPHRRRDTAVAGYTATAVLTAAIGVTTAAWQVAVLRAGGWAARGLRVPSLNALASIPGGHVAHRYRNVRVLALGVAAFLIAYLGFGMVGSTVVGLMLLFAAAGIGIGLVETAEHVAVASLAPNEVRGSAFGLLAATQSFGNLAASAMAGALWTLVSPRVAFLYLAAWMLVSLAAFAGARPSVPARA
jgi:hypothetical protein